MKRRMKPIGIGVLIWDVAWKIVAIRRAVERREYWWIAPLAVVNSIGLLPMLYLARSRRPAPGDEPNP
jgi:hypothetical protein